MFQMDEEFEQQTARQQELETLKQHLREYNQPTQITFMVQDLHCWPIFPIVGYVAATVFRISPDEFQRMCSQKVDTLNEEAQE